MNNLLCFDLEIVWGERWPTLEELASDEPFDIWDYWPFDISVGAVGLGNTVSAWHMQDYAPWGRQMLIDFIAHLVEKAEQGYRIASWNGVGFDFQLLARALPTLRHTVEDLSRHSYDLAFQMLCLKGYMVGMNAAAQGFGLPGKSEDGADAPTLWSAGEYQRVIEYVKQDVVVLQTVMRETARHRGLRWVNKQGQPRFQPLRGFLTANQCLQLPLPDTSWMDAPIRREDVLGWWSPKGA